MKVNFTVNAQVRGRGYRRGDVAELDEPTARAYIEAQQAKPYASPPADPVSPPHDEDHPARHTVKRAGKKVSTATGLQGESR